MRHWYLVLIVAAGCTAANSHLLVDGDGGGDMAIGAQHDLFGFDGSAETDLAGLDLASSVTPDMASGDGGDFGFTGDLATCAPTAVAVSAGFASTNFANPAFTLTVPAGFHITGNLGLTGDKPPGTSLTDGFSSFVTAVSTQGRRYIAQVTVPAGAGKAFTYDVAVPAGTYQLDWIYTLQYAGGIFITRRGRVDNVAVVCSDVVRDLDVPSFGAMTSATATVQGLSALPGTDDGSLDLVVDFSTADNSFSAEASVNGVVGDSAGIPIFVPSFGTAPSVRVSLSSFSAASYQSTIKLDSVAGGQATYTLTLPLLSALAGEVTDPGNELASFVNSALVCDGTNGIDQARGLLSNGSTAYLTVFPRNRSCAPYFVYAVTVDNGFAVNENQQVALFAPDNFLAGAVAIVSPSPSPFPSPSPLPVPALGTMVTVFGQLNASTGAALPNYAIRAASTSLNNAALHNDFVGVSATFDPVAVTVTTDNNGQFKLHLPAGTYDITARQQQ